jgi:hypothetical protein
VLPAGVEFVATNAYGDDTPFVTTRNLDLAQVTLSALQVDPGTGVLSDNSRDLSDHLPVSAYGNDPLPGAALYFGFDALPSASPVALWLLFGGPGNDAAARERIVAEAAAQKAACSVNAPGWPCGGNLSKPAARCSLAAPPVPLHHSAKVVWEYFAGGSWSALAQVATPARPATGEVVDDTRSLTLDGLVEFNLPASIARTALGTVAASLYYIRVRLASGAYDAPVVVENIGTNAVSAVQRLPLWQSLAIAGNLLPLPAPPSPGAEMSLQFTLSADLTVQALAVKSPPAPGQPAFRLLNYAAPGGGTAGSIAVEFAVAGLGTAVPSQQLYVSGAPLMDRCFRLFTHDGTNWTGWNRVADFDSACRTDLSYTLDSTTGLLICGDGERGQTFPQGSAIVVTGFTTLADDGNLSAQQKWSIAQTPGNAAVLASLSPSDQSLISQIVANPVPAAGGAPAAPLTELEGEAAQVIAAHERILGLAESAQQTTLDQIPKSQVLALPAPAQAVNLLDTERIAIDVPGTVVARARAWPDTDPALPGIHAAGVVTVVILPGLPVAEPTPSPGLIAAVQQYLGRRRVLCTRIEVAAPRYVVIAVSATVQALTGASAVAVASAIQAALDGFLNPTTGGPAGLGWPFGRNVFNAEILQLIAAVPGVDYVTSLAMTANAGTPQCGDIAICSAFLVTSGTHTIQVVNS